MTWTANGGGGPAFIDLGVALAPNRFCRFNGVPLNAALCTSGQDCDATTLPQADFGGGLGLQIESGASFAAGATLQSDASGRAITWASGVKIARALEAASAAGQVVWVSILSGR